MNLMVLFIESGWRPSASEKEVREIGAFSDVLVYSVLSENVFNTNLDATFGAYRNIFLGHKKAVCELSAPNAESGDEISVFLENSCEQFSGSILCLISFINILLILSKQCIFPSQSNRIHRSLLCIYV